MNLDAYSMKDIQHCQAIVSEAASAGIAVADLERLLAGKVSAMMQERLSQPADRRTMDRQPCDCGHGIRIRRSREDVTYYVCVDPKTGQAGCGWSRMVSK